MNMDLDRIFLVQLWGDEFQHLVAYYGKLQRGEKLSPEEEEILDLIIIDINTQFEDPVNSLPILPN